MVGRARGARSVEKEAECRLNDFVPRLENDLSRIELKRKSKQECTHITARRRYGFLALCTGPFSREDTLILHQLFVRSRLLLRRFC
jgi:hypothetical protein